MNCKIKGCKRVHYAKGYCRNHYRQNRYRTDSEYREASQKQSRESWRRLYKKKKKEDKTWNAKRQREYRKKHPEAYAKMMFRYYKRKLGKK